MEEPALPSSKLPEMRNHFLLSEHKSFSLNKIKWRRTCQRCFRGELFHSSPLLGANMKIRHQGLCVYIHESARSILPGSCRRAVVRLLGVGLLALFVVSNLRADDVTFLDASGSMSVNTSSSRITATCTTEQCNAMIVAPQAATFSSTSLFPPLHISELNGTISDTLDSLPTCAATPCGQDALASFQSDDDSGAGLFGGQTCADFSNPCITENGSVQQGGTITWDNGTVDTIFFKSDFERTPEVPEPGTLVLLGSGLISLVGFARRNIFRA